MTSSLGSTPIFVPLLHPLGLVLRAKVLHGIVVLRFAGPSALHCDALPARSHFYRDWLLAYPVGRPKIRSPERSDWSAERSSRLRSSGKKILLPSVEKAWDIRGATGDALGRGPVARPVAGPSDTGKPLVILVESASRTLSLA
jgi:hypothetical protein